MFYSVVETKDLPSEATPETILKEFQDQKDSNELHFTGQIGEVEDCEFVGYKITGTILPFDELPITIEIVNPEGKIVGSESFTIESSTFQKNIKVDDWSVSGTYLIHLTYKYLVYEEKFEPNIKFPTEQEISDCRFKQSVEEQIENVVVQEPELVKSISTPLKQTHDGISPDDIICKDGLELIFKNNDSPACVKPETASVLIERGLAKLAS